MSHDQHASDLPRWSDGCRLSDTLAARRCLYPAPTGTVPDVLLIDIPKGHRGAALLLKRWYPVILENVNEHAEFQEFLTARRPAPIALDLLDRRPSHAQSTGAVITRYDPSADGWPWLLVCRWPDTWSRSAARMGLELARGCYTTDAFVSERDLDSHVTAMLSQLSGSPGTEIRLIAGDRLSVGGSA